MSLLLDIKLYLVETFPILLKYHRWKVKRQNKKLEKEGANYRYAPYILPITDTPTIGPTHILRKPDTVETYYLIGYDFGEGEDKKSYFYMEQEYNTVNHTLTISHKVKRFIDKEEAIEYCKELNNNKSETDEFLYVYERTAQYYDKRIEDE